MSGDETGFPPQYKAAVEKANDMLAEGATRIMAICEELVEPFDKEQYELELDSGITIRITKAKT